MKAHIVAHRIVATQETKEREEMEERRGESLAHIYKEKLSDALGGVA